jgi:hypothetical protein
MFWKFIAEGSEQGVSEGSEGGIVGAKLKTLPAMFTLTATRTTMQKAYGPETCHIPPRRGGMNHP